MDKVKTKGNKLARALLGKRLSRRGPMGWAGRSVGFVLMLTMGLGGNAWAATYYWDTNGSTAGFGTAGGTWGTSADWSTSNAGTATPTAATTTTSDSINFGFTSTGLAAGAITVGSVSAGNITFATASGAIVLSSGTITLAAADSITLNNSADTIGSVIAGAGTSLTLAGTGTLTLSGANTFTGNLIVSSAMRVNFDSTNASGGGQIQIQATGASLTNSNTASAPGDVSNAIALNSTGIAFTPGNVAAVSGTYTPGTFISTLGATTSSNSTSPIIFSGVISGNSDLNISNSPSGGGGGPVTLGLAGTPGGSSGYETYTGATTINNSGVITMAASNVLPTTTDVIVATQSSSGAATLNLNGFNQQIGSISDGADATASAHTLTITNNGISSPATLTIGDSITPDNGFSGPITDGSSTLALVKTGIDTISLTGNKNAFSGGVTVNEGTLTASGTGALGTGFVTVNPTGTAGTSADAATLNTNTNALAGGTVLTVNTNSATAIGTVNFTSGGPGIGSLSGNGNVVLDKSTGTALTIGSSTNLSSTFSGVISEGTPTEGSIIKADTGTLTLTGPNAYTGGTTISAGTLAFANGSLSNAGAITVNGGTLKWASGNTQDISARLTLQNSGAATLDTGVNLVTLATAFGGSTSSSVTKIGTGTLTLSAANTYTGGTKISNGTLDFANGSLGATGAITVNGGTLQWASGNTQDISARLTLQNSGAATLDTQANNVTFATGFGGSTSSSVTKVGSGTLNLTGSDTFTGPTTINAGTLEAGAAGALHGTSSVTVNSTGTLLLGNSASHFGSSTGITLAGGTFNTGGFNDGPTGGASGSTANIGTLTLSTNSSIIDFGSGNNGSNLLVSNMTETSGTYSLAIYDWSGTTNGASGGSDNGATTNDRLLFTTDPGLTSGELADISFYSGAGTGYLGTGAEITFNGYTEIVAAVPEPTTVFGALALAGLLGYRERRRLLGLIGSVKKMIRRGFRCPAGWS